MTTLFRLPIQPCFRAILSAPIISQAQQDGLISPATRAFRRHRGTRSSRLAALNLVSAAISLASTLPGQPTSPSWSKPAPIWPPLFGYRSRPSRSPTVRFISPIRNGRITPPAITASVRPDSPRPLSPHPARKKSVKFTLSLPKGGIMLCLRLTLSGAGRAMQLNGRCPAAEPVPKDWERPGRNNS